MHNQKSFSPVNKKHYPGSPHQFNSEMGEIDISFPFRPLSTVSMCPEADISQGHLLKLDLGYTELEEQIKVVSGCSA